MEKSKLQNIARQLANPRGKEGIDIGKAMDEQNISMTLNCLNHFNFEKNDMVLELGHGFCGHLKNILDAASGIFYQGLEISPLMKKEATQRNNFYLDQGLADFKLYDGTFIPFADESFDKIFTVNTIYFWKEPEILLSQICRVLKKGGTFCITWADKTFMESLPFTFYGFQLYDQTDFENFIQKAALTIKNVESTTEKVLSKTDEVVNRKFYTYTLSKN